MGVFAPNNLMGARFGHETTFQKQGKCQKKIQNSVQTRHDVI